MRRILVLALAFGWALPAASPAAAETRTLQGSALVLTDTLDSVVLTRDPDLTGQIRLSSDGDLSCLSEISGSAVVIGTSGCSDDAGPLRIEVGSATSVTLNASGDGTVHLGDLHGPLVMNLTGSVDVQGGNLATLVLTSRSAGDVVLGSVDGTAILNLLGSGDVRLRDVHGYLGVHQHGSADLDIGSIVASSADLDGTGSGDMLIGSGSITTLRAHFAGSGDCAVAATMGDADVAAAGGGDVKLGRVTGHLNKSASGGSDIIVGGPELVDSVIGKLARVIGEGGGQRGSSSSDGGFSLLGHFLTIGFVGVVLFIIWRIVQRAGGAGEVRRRMGRQAPQAPTHPGVLALGEMMTRLEQRLGRVEGYVTSREFDLNQKFRELGPR